MEQNRWIIEKMFRKKYWCFVSFANNITGDLALSEDAVQIAMLKLLTGNVDLSKSENIFPYFVQAVRCAAFTLMTRYRNRIKREQKWSDDNIETVYNIPEQRESLFPGILKKSLENLPPAQANIIELRFIQEMKDKEIAQHCNLTVHAVEAKRFKAYQSIRSFIQTGAFWPRHEIDAAGKKIIKLKREGRTNDEIATEVGLTKRQVRARINHYKNKLHVI